MPVAAGSTFLLPKPGHSTPHLWVVVTEPDDRKPPHVAIVNLTSSPMDDTVVLVHGDHPFVRHETFIYYEDAKIVAAARLLEAVEMGVASRHTELDHRVLARIQDGVRASPHVPPMIREYCDRRF